ncbi:unnamed protein product [Cochlearia groenlandica]
MHYPMHSNGSFGPDQMNLPHSHTALPPPPVQQLYMYPPPPPPHPASAQLTTMPGGTTQSFTNPSCLYPFSQGETQAACERLQSQQFYCHLPPVSMLPPPPPLPPGIRSPGQALPNPFHPLPSFPLRSLEPPGMPLPPPPPRTSSPLVADTTCHKPEAAKNVCDSVSLNGVALDHEGPVVEDAGSSKESSIHCDESSSPHDVKTEHDPDIEMEDDITLPEDENCQSQPFDYGSDQFPSTCLKTEQPLQGTANGSRPSFPLTYSRRAKIKPQCSLGDMYDPFVDSFEPASVKLECVQEHEPANGSYNVVKESISPNRPVNVVEKNEGGGDKQALSESDMTARVSVSSNKPPEVEENTTENDIKLVVSEDNNEFGENADSGREGNSHETDTPNSHDDNLKILDANNSIHEDDRSRTRKKSEGDPKEKDSSRSMKLFKVVLTKFVKDLLKPSWRQGNMSKEAFKTIVKRVVEKVSNSMEGRHIPKSRAKIDRYIDSSRHKLTKLVMGYVDKYVKS